VGLAEGAVVTPGGLQRVAPGIVPSFVAADVTPGAQMRDVRTRYEQQAAVSVPHPPPELQSYERVDNVPVILAAALGALGVGILSHALVTSIRRRRRELAVLKTVGFVRPQVGVAVVCEATTLIALALLVGLPLGVAAGRWAWALFADKLGVVAEPVVSFPYGLILVAAIALVLANMVVAPPGRSAARTRPAVALRSE
jgi:ABC-type antimicrobial peptide transport system permease subunit